MAIFFRGSQSKDWRRGVRGSTSWTPCLAAAVVYAAKPGEGLLSSGPAFLKTSTVFAAEIEYRSPLILPKDTTLRHVLESLRFGHDEGMSLRDVKSTLMYLSKRYVGAVPGGSFKFVLLDEDGDPREDEGFISLRRTPIHDFWQDFEFEDEDAQLHEAGLFVSDSFVFADAKPVQDAARRLGYDAIVYEDVFGGAEYALPDLVGISPDEVSCLFHDEDPMSFWSEEDEYQWYHETVRPLNEEIVEITGSVPAQDAAESLRSLFHD